MKTFFYAALLLVFFTACRHQKAVTADETTYSKPPAPTQTGNPGPAPAPTYTMTTTQGDVQIQTDESTTATIIIDNPVDSVVTTVVAPGDTTQHLYRLTVSFISRGEGIDYKAKENFENWLKAQPRRIGYEETHWGREGETNFCLKLNELSTKEQETFVRDARTQLNNNQLVIVSEYAACKGTK